MSSLPTLYTISGNILAVLDQMEENGGELTPELEQALAITEDQFTEKAVDYGLAIRNLDAMAKAAKEEKDRLALLQKFYENAKRRLSDAISGAMQALDHPKVETPTLRLFLRHTQATEIDNADEIPARFKVTKVETVVDKTAVKKAIVAGEDVPGARLIENVSLQIK